VNQQVARLESLAYRLALQDMTGGIPSTWGGLHEFNDDDYTTQEEAILVLKRARANIEEHQEREDQPGMNTTTTIAEVFVAGSILSGQSGRSNA
jgi:hypothetical protein